MNNSEIIPQLFKSEYRKILSVLCNAFNFNNIQIAEDIANETFLLASETWGLKGYPENPRAWLYFVAKNKAKDFLKRKLIFEKKVQPSIKSEYNHPHFISLDFSDSGIQDSQLKMMLNLCNPELSSSAQICLALRILCGFSIEEIADAFLTNKVIINKRLARAKEKLRKSKFEISTISNQETLIRLPTVLKTIYLLFNAGYYSKNENSSLNLEFCLEAIRLTKLLIENKSTAEPQVFALMSLMCFHSSRFESRISNQWGDELFTERKQHDEDLVNQGNKFLIKSASGNQLTKYHLEAAIAYWHCSSIDHPTKWPNILDLYNKLLLIEYSPIIALNRTYAFSKVYGKKLAVIEALKLKQNTNHYYFSLLAYLNTGVDNLKAKQLYITAIELAKSDKEKDYLSKRLTLINQAWS